MFKNYFLIEGEYTVEDQTHIGYGIGCYTDGEEMVFEDLSIDYRKISNFIDICNRLTLSPMHLRDAVDDFLIENATL